MVILIFMSTSLLMSKPLNFLVLWTCNFVKLVSGPTHNHGHTLDIVFTLGLTILSLPVEEMGISDHVCIRFSTMFHNVPKVQLPASYSCTINSSTASSHAYLALAFSCHIEVHSSCLSKDKLINQFNSTCVDILNSVAPFKLILLHSNLKLQLNPG